MKNFNLLTVLWNRIPYVFRADFVRLDLKYSELILLENAIKHD